MKSRAEDAESWVSFPTTFLLGEILILDLLIATVSCPARIAGAFPCTNVFTTISSLPQRIQTTTTAFSCALKAREI